MHGPSKQSHQNEHTRRDSDTSPQGQQQQLRTPSPPHPSPPVSNAPPLPKPHARTQHSHLEVPVLIPPVQLLSQYAQVLQVNVKQLLQARALHLDNHLAGLWVGGVMAVVGVGVGVEVEVVVSPMLSHALLIRRAPH